MDQTCRMCGHISDGAARFCSECGIRLPSGIDEQTQVLTPVAVADLDPLVTEAVLVATSGHREGMRYPLASDRVTIGRHPDSDVFLDDITVSRRHALIERSSAGFVLSDAGSLNGTYCNGRRIDADVLLTSGDDLLVGKFRLRYSVPAVGQ